VACRYRCRLTILEITIRCEVRPNGAGGASCGVSNAIKTAIRHPEVKSLVLLSGPSDPKDRMFLRQTKIPTFFAVSDDDPYTLMVPFTEWLYLATASPEKKFAHYKTGGPRRGNLFRTP
jgi:hypothetical protein